MHFIPFAEVYVHIYKGTCMCSPCITIVWADCEGHIQQLLDWTHVIGHYNASPLVNPIF